MRSRTKRRWLVVTVIVVFHVVGFLSSIDAVMKCRTSQGAIAWAVSLNTVPYVAVPAYWVLGRSRFQGYVDSRREGDHEIRQVALDASRLTMDQRSDRGAEDPLARASEMLAKIPVLQNNQVDLLVDGHETFESIFRGIEAAEDYILVQFFIVKDDEIGRDLKSQLLAKAREGVRVYFLYDEVGSHSLSKSYIQELREAGAEVLDFHTRKGPGNRFQINFRNHRKIVVVDGHTAWVGGHNVGDEYMGRDPEFGHWRDTHVKITGPAALPVQLSFLEDWYWAARRCWSWPGHRTFRREGLRRVDLPDRSGRSAGDSNSDVCQRHQWVSREAVDREPLLRARRIADERTPFGRLAGRGCSYHHPRQGGSHARMVGRVLLLRRSL